MSHLVFGPKWIRRFLDLSRVISSWSKDPSTRCGAVIVDARRRIVSVGYNGFPDSIPDKPEWYEDRAQKYDMVIHAEANAILNAPGPVQGCSMFVTGPCCIDCAKTVVQAGISSVYYCAPDTPEQLSLVERWAESLARAFRVFNRADLPVYEFDMATGSTTQK